ncbi:MAG: hypothetical protein A2176_09805 [Spirochaetes bacterium RBG_13_51_14]|nr:MAG: hypothetical protein A2176_09805 [Spirochaetes bacterium RBG_13_51_14]
MKKLVLFSQVYSTDEYDKKPLPDDILNSEGAILAHKGHAIPKEKLTNVFIAVDDVFTATSIPTGADKRDVPAADDRQDAASPVPQVETPAAEEPSRDDYPSGLELTEEYEEESAEKIERYLVDLEFEPIPKIKTALRTNIHSMKEIFRKKIVNNMIFLVSVDNERITRQIAEYLYHILDTNLFASDYLDMVTAIRTKNNYVTFSHALSVAFYTMAIAKKLKMLKDDFLVSENLGRWLPVKTQHHSRLSGPVPFSNQLLKYIDRQTYTIMIKYDSEVKEVLLERLHDLMHEYAKIDPKKNNYPSLTPGYDENMLNLLTMAAINSDIGKLCVPNRILNKKGPLSSAEWNLMKQHPAFSVSKLKEVNVNLPKMFAHIIGHHILDEATGYPKAKGSVPPETKIITVADIYDAMTAPKHYGRIHSNAEASQFIRELHQKGSIDLPLCIAAVHTFGEYNHEFVMRRHRKVADAESSEEIE